MAQWLRLHAPYAGGLGSIPGQWTSSHMPKWRVWMPQLKKKKSCIPQLKIPHAATKTWSELKVTQSCPTLWNSMHYTVHEILQAKILEWVAFPFSRRSSQPRIKPVSCIAGGFFTSWAIREAHLLKWHWQLSLSLACHGERSSNNTCHLQLSGGWGFLHLSP